MPSSTDYFYGRTAQPPQKTGYYRATPSSYNLSTSNRVPTRSINDPSRKSSGVSHVGLWITVGIALLVIIGWSIYLIVTYWRREGFFAYVRPGTLPDQVGPTIAPNPITKQYDYDPTQSLTNRAVFLGGDPVPLTEAQQKALQEKAAGEITAWKNYTPPPISNNKG